MNQLNENNPYLIFEQWYDKALQEGNHLANKMTVSTVSTRGFPSSRLMYLASYKNEYLTFYTNAYSRKYKHIERIPSVALLFDWGNHIVRIEGDLQQLDRKCVEEHFLKLDYKEQVILTMSYSSLEIPDYDDLLMEYDYMIGNYTDKTIPCPHNYAGYKVIVKRFEFIDIRLNLLHKRLKYCWKNDHWKIKYIST